MNKLIKLVAISLLAVQLQACGIGMAAAGIGAGVGLYNYSKTKERESEMKCRQNYADYIIKMQSSNNKCMTIEEYCAK